MRNIYSALVQFVYLLCSWWWIMLTQSIKTYSHAKSLIKSYQKASKAESFCDWDRWSTAYLTLLQIYIYIFDFSGEQPSTKRLQGSRFPSLFANNFIIYTPKRNACVGGGSSDAILPTPRNPFGLLLLLNSYTDSRGSSVLSIFRHDWEETLFSPEKKENSLGIRLLSGLFTLHLVSKSLVLN